ncbi:MAG: response regulator [Candidatus Aureabacteria bacterium]|nr:response regulator [Candidatus Auribacterota bacterium]
MGLENVLNSEETIYFRQTFSNVLQMVGQDLNTLLQNALSMKDIVVDFQSKEQASEEFSDAFIKSVSLWEGKCSSQVDFLFRSRDAKALSQVLMGEFKGMPGEDEEMTNEDLEIFKEISNQINGSLDKALRNAFSFDFHALLGDVEKLDLLPMEKRTGYFSHEGYLIVKNEFSIKDSEKTYWALLIPMEIIRQISTLQSESIGDEIQDEIFEKRRYALVTDDDPVMRKIMKKYLEKLNITSLDAVDGMDAIKKAKDSRFDIIFLDIIMPNMDGISTLKKLKIMSETRNVPILMASSKSTKEEVINALKSGASDFLVKPITLKELFLRLKRVLSSKKS